MICSKCEDQLLAEDSLTCMACSMKFHYGCVSVAEANFRKMGSRKNTWKCLDCQQQKKKKDETFTIPLKDSGDMSSLFMQLSQDIKNSVNSIREELNTNTNRMEQKMNEVLMKMNEMQNKHEEMKIKQDEMAKENEELKKTISELKENYDQKIDSLENRTRMSNIEIRNMPETQGEDVLTIVQEIGRVIGISDIKEGDIQVAHRVDSRNRERGNRPIIAHLASRYLRNKWLQNFKNYRKANNGLTANKINNNLPDALIYLNEHLTVKMKILLNKAKEFAKTKNIKYVWTKDAFILMKKDDSDRHVKKISSEKELDNYKKNF